MNETDWLAAPLVPIAWCWRIERTDGATLGLTTHDQPISIAGLTYSPAPGIRPSAIRQRRGIGGDSVDVEGALATDAITAADLNAGRWDGAAVRLIVADWQAPDARNLVIATGRLGNVSSDGVGFTAELDGRDPALNARVAPETSAECRAELGDRACRVALHPRTHRARIASVSASSGSVSNASATITLAPPPSGAWGADMLTYGRIRWLEGRARGLTATIIAQSGNAITLSPLPEGGAAAGLAVEIIEGCDKRAATCSARFANIANFQGEPHLPGIDLLTRFPGG